MMRRVCWGWPGWRWSACAPLGVRIVQLVTDDPDAARCPVCRVVSTSGKDWVLTRPHDLPSGGGQIAVQWRKRRWRCRTVDCARATFTEQVAQVPAGMRTTTRLRTAPAGDSNDAGDLLTGTTFIQRLNTQGGTQPPAAECKAQTENKVKEV